MLEPAAWMGGFQAIRVTLETGGGEMACIGVSVSTRGMVEGGSHPVLGAIGVRGDLLK